MNKTTKERMTIWSMIMVLLAALTLFGCQRTDNKDKDQKAALATDEMPSDDGHQHAN
jgi:hypothetical protein